jgi:mono/diheme cytochrome c family protein
MKRNARTTILTGILLSAVAGPAIRATGDGGQATPAAAANRARVERGAYLVHAMGCNDCHTPYKMGPNGPEPDMSRQLTGHPAGLVMPPPPKLPEGPWVGTAAGTNTAFAGPWGVSFTANLTPDPETGLGRWTEDMFIATMKTGRHQGKGRPILPPMPYPNVGGLNDEDIRAVFAYLQSLPPVSNRVPAPIDPPEGGRW